MKSITKKLSVSLLSAAALALSFSAVKAYGAANAEEVTAATASASMVYGASVRVNGDDYTQNGIRFSMMMNQADYAAVKAKTNPVFGVMIVPQAYNIAGDSAKMLAILNGTDEEYSVDASAEGKKQIWNVSGDSMLYFEANEEENRAAGYYFSGVMVNVQQDNLDRRFVGVGYYGYGDEIKLAAFNQNNIENNTRSVVKVAYEAAQTETENAAWLNANYVQKCTYAVVLDKHNGEENATQTVHYGEKLATPVAPDREGYELDGWYVGGKKYSFDTPVRGGGTLHAVWKKDITSEAAEGTLKNNVTAESQSIATEFNEVKKLTDESGNAIKFTFGADKKLTVQSSAVSALAAGEYNFCVWTEDYAYTKVKVAVAEEVADGGFENVTRIPDSQVWATPNNKVSVSSTVKRSGINSLKTENGNDARWAGTELKLSDELLNKIGNYSVLSFYVYISSANKNNAITGFNVRMSTYDADKAQTNPNEPLKSKHAFTYGTGYDGAAMDTWIKVQVSGSDLALIKSTKTIVLYNELCFAADSDAKGNCNYEFYVDDFSVEEASERVMKFNNTDAAAKITEIRSSSASISYDSGYDSVLIHNGYWESYGYYKVQLDEGFLSGAKESSILKIQVLLDKFEYGATSFKLQIKNYLSNNNDGGVELLNADLGNNAWVTYSLTYEQLSKISENALWLYVKGTDASGGYGNKLYIKDITLTL